MPLPDHGAPPALADIRDRLARAAALAGRKADAVALIAVSKTQAPEAIEPLRREKILGSSLEAAVALPELPTDADGLAELFIVSSVAKGDALAVAKTDNHKCGRCWRYLPEVEDDGHLCARCETVLNG